MPLEIEDIRKKLCQGCTKNETELSKTTWKDTLSYHNERRIVAGTSTIANASCEHTQLLFFPVLFFIWVLFTAGHNHQLDPLTESPRKQQQQQSTLFQSFLFGMLPVERADPQNLTGYVKGYVSF